MSEETKQHSEAHEEFVNEEGRSEGIKVGISRIIDRLPFKISAEITRRDLVTELKKEFEESGHQFKVSDRGWLLATDKSGAQVDLTEAVSEALLADKTLVDAESVSAAVESGALGVQAKSDLRTTQQKVRYISKFGEQAFAKLPLNRTPAVTNDLGSMTGKQYRDLPRSEKVRITALVGLKGVEEILGRK